MNREGFSKIRRTELLARLTALDPQIEAQEKRVRYIDVLSAPATLGESAATPLTSRFQAAGRGR